MLFRKDVHVALVVAMPLLLCLAFAAIQYASATPARLGDDWIYFHEFDFLPLWSSDGPCALTKNGSIEDGLRFRPFCYTWIWCERQLFAAYVPSWLSGVAWIGASAVFLGLWLVSLGVERARAALAAVIFALHPAQVEVWGWASARIDTMACALGFAGLWALARHARVLAFFALLFAYGSKESAYPLLLVAPLVPLLRGQGWRRSLVDGGVAAGALLALFTLKAAVLGRVFAESWGQALQDIPIGMRLSGWISFLDPLLLDPVSSVAQSKVLFVSVLVFGAVWLGSLVLSLALPPVLFAIRSRRGRLRMAARWRRVLPLAVLFLLAFALTVTVSFGVPARPDLGGGRLWFFPSAFLIAALTLFASRLPLVLLLGLSAVLLHANLAPYRHASASMLKVERRLATEIADPRRAVRVADLPAVDGPVPLFILMAELWAIGLDGSRPTAAPPQPSDYPRVFLSWKRDDAEDQRAMDALDEVWSKAMQARGYSVTRLHWKNGALEAR